MSQPSLDAPFTKKLHKTTYEAISPSKPSLSARDKTILITGDSAGYRPLNPPVLSIPVDQVWRDFDTNVKANLNLVRNYLAPESLTKTKKILNVSTAAAHAHFPMMASYGASKEAFVHLLMHIQAEYAEKGVRITSFQPGTILTKMAKSAGFTEDSAWNFDDASLSGDFAVWLASNEANWDIDELKARSEEIKNTDLLKIGLIGEPANRG